MNRNLAQILRRSTVASALFLAVASSAWSAEVFFSGTARGAFNGGAAANTDSYLGLDYFGSSFADSTVNGFVGFGGDPEETYPGNVNNFGALRLTIPAAGVHVYSDQSFLLQLSFTAPTNIQGGQDLEFVANILGSVNSIGDGGVEFDFDNTPLSLPFGPGIDGLGVFQITVNDLAINPGQTKSVNGFITAQTGPSDTVIPEPGTASLMLSAVALVGAGVWRRNRYNRAG